MKIASPASPPSTPPAAQPSISFDGATPLGPDAIEAVARGDAQVAISETARLRMAHAKACLDGLKADNRLIYGVTTGYGPLAQSYIDQSLSGALQRNLVYHLASGVGDLLSPQQARAATAARLATLVRGHSAASPSLALFMGDVLNAGLVPAIPAKGTVGASGDLTPLSHLALALMGEGAFITPDGRLVPGADALQAAGLEPITLEDKDGLALVNGISVTAGIAALNGQRARRLAHLTLAVGVAYTELLGGHREAWHPAVGRVRAHKGQGEAHDLLWRWSAEAPRLVPAAPRPPRHGEGLAGARVLQDQPLPQDVYTMRCLPQLVGAVFDVLRFHEETVTVDINGVSDNPLIFPDTDGRAEGDQAGEETPVLLHAGNFFGQQGAFASDALTNAVISLAGLLERQIARITDPALNGPLPPFLQARATGLHSGFMGAQVTASALLAELRAKAMPASIQSIPTNGNNQDVVPLGTIAARRAGESLEDAERILAIALMAIAQAADLSREGPPLGPHSSALADRVRDHVPFLDHDRPLGPDIEALAAAIGAGDIAV
ncbi:MAG: histidine ammonia-lyase [Alphaproteobacteria bacterium]